MRRTSRRGTKKAGLAPGTLVHIGEEKVERVRITVMIFNEKEIREEELDTVEQPVLPDAGENVMWINVVGIHHLETVETLGRLFGLHPLTLEDIVNTEQRPKMEDYNDYLFVVLMMLDLDNTGGNDLRSEQVSLVVKPNVLISFQEREGDVFESVRQRLRAGKGRIREKGSDYLAYALMDSIVDHYFVVLEKLGDALEDLQDAMVAHPTEKALRELYRIRREVIFLRRAVWPLRELVVMLVRGESSIIKESTSIFLRDVQDHAVQVIDTIEVFREMLSGLLDVYLSSISNRMNEIMKVLTIIATIFIPLTFIAGVYGMNFEYMPELKWRWGYPAVLILMGAAAMWMLVYFRTKKWI